mmetsp:Transcript_100732/g.123351  ORF Transcript_100732/g.123351 Transcript_100732/m.123351 type:complete len:201 (-) Transcript_100732:44-646(-)
MMEECLRQLMEFLRPIQDELCHFGGRVIKNENMAIPASQLWDLAVQHTAAHRSTDFDLGRIIATHIIGRFCDEFVEVGRVLDSLLAVLKGCQDSVQLLISHRCADLQKDIPAGTLDARSHENMRHAHSVRVGPGERKLRSCFSPTCQVEARHEGTICRKALHTLQYDLVCQSKRVREDPGSISNRCSIYPKQQLGPILGS